MNHSGYRLAYLTPGLTHLQGGPATAVVTIQDNEHVPVTLSWEQSDVTVGEHVGSATLRAYAVTTVDKRPEVGFAFDASISTSNGSADPARRLYAGGRYRHVQPERLQPGNRQRRTPLSRRKASACDHIQDDTADEDEEDFTATIEIREFRPAAPAGRTSHYERKDHRQ